MFLYSCMNNYGIIGEIQESTITVLRIPIFTIEQPISAIENKFDASESFEWIFQISHVNHVCF